MSLSALFPLVAIIVLNSVKDPTVRLGLMAVFTVAFSVCLGLVSTARKAVFIGTMLYALFQTLLIARDGDL